MYDKLLSNQEIFNKVAAHLLAQNARATKPDGKFCMYKTPEGKKCAVGALIPDLVYSESLESCGSISGGSSELYSALHSGGVNADANETNALLVDLQTMHDDETIDPSEWRGQLEIIAQNHGLTMEVE